ncbi:flagellar basal-body rod protein FlgF [Desulfovibrio sp. OttesenSCG-928-I05]|nr:flagellar basal-body rod protein FlgF [Desulfovibrio sp. OttesenSCG-928-I05]
MQSAMYSGLFGALTSEHRMNSIANNLANVNTTGYKRDRLAFQDTFQMYAHDMIFEAGANIRDKKMFPEPTHFARTRISVAQTDFQQGALKGTSSPFDVALGGDGFFRVQTPDGEFYTRNGHFRTTAEGLLITEQGYTVMGEGGEITVPAGYRDLVIAEDGRMFADGLQFGQLAVVGVANPEVLEKMGHNLYRPRNGAEVEEAAVDPTATRVMQGFLEAPNVDAVYEMVNMIETQRHFEAMQKVMQSSDTIDREAISKVGKRV